MNKKESKSAEHHDFLQGQINAAEAIMRAAQFEIRSRKLPDVHKCQSSLSAWKQFCMYFNIWVKHLKTKREVNAEGKVVRVNDPLAYEGIGSYLKKSFGHWASMVGLEIWAVISLGFDWVFVNIGKGAGFVGLQVSRFFQWIKKRNYWNSLKWNMQLREFKKRFDIWREKKRVEHHERAVNRQVLAVERETQRKEEAARKAAVRKEEEAIRQARLEEAAALKHTQEIEAEIAAIALRRKQEEQRVHEQIQRKEEAQKLLQEARETEEKERAVFEAQRQEQEKAREEAARQAEEAKARLEVLRKEDEERKRLAAAREEELKRLKEEEERLAEEKRLAEVKRLEDEKKLEEAKAAAEKQAAEAQLKPSFAQKRQAEIEQRSELAKEEIRIQEEAEEKEEQLRLAKEQQEAQEKEKAEQERLRAQEIKAQEEQEREAEETAKRLHKEAEEKRLQELEAKREQEEAEYLKKRAAEPVKTSQPKPALAAAAVRSAVKSIPVSMPSVSIPDAQARERMMTDARDRTSNFIRRTIIRSEINSVIGNPAEAVKLTALKFAIIGLVTAASAYIGVLNNSETAVNPGAGSFIVLFLAIAVIGTLLEVGGGILCGILLDRAVPVSQTAVLEKNSVYTVISGMLFSLCGVLLMFSREKFTAVFAALVLLSAIGHIWVLYRVSERKTWYSILIYLLVVFIVVAVILLVMIMMRGTVSGIWNALA